MPYLGIFKKDQDSTRVMFPAFVLDCQREISSIIAVTQGHRSSSSSYGLIVGSNVVFPEVAGL